MVSDQSMGGVRSRHLGICPTARFSRHRLIRRGQTRKNLSRTCDIRENVVVKATITESALSDIRSRIAQLPPPMPTDRVLRIDEATVELYDDIRGAILAGHSIASLAEKILVPSGWTASSERIRRALLGIARQRRDKELGDRIGGLRPRRHRAKPKAAMPTPTLPTRPTSPRGASVAVAVIGSGKPTQTIPLPLE